MSEVVILAGATGDLGARIAKALTLRGSTVRALVRPGTAEDRLSPLRALGVEIRPVDFADGTALTDACRGAVCVVSALSGLEPVIVGAQTQLLEAAVTTKDDTAAYTAAAALDPDAPRDLHIAGSDTSTRDLASDMTAITGSRYRPMRAGSLNGLARLIRLVRRVFPAKGAVFPSWQGMQYLHNMFSGLAPSAPTDNDRYPGPYWTSAWDVLARA